jgi:oxygen-independent coproporphyrinogen-3 oxidase
MIPAYIQALCAEIRFVRASVGQQIPIHTIFVGGGTPSLLPLAELGRLFEVISQEFNLFEGAEITLEANPEKLSANYLKGLQQLGINRISLGVQSADSRDLRILERQHDFLQVAAAIKLIRKAGFENLNLDLIFGIPHQTIESWKSSLMIALELQPEHFSLYALTVEHGTPMADWVSRGLLPQPNPDLAADMYLWAAEHLDQHGFMQYEISNWAQLDTSGVLLSCKHNLQYWRNHPYLGLGAGAHGYANGIRTANTISPREYIRKCLNIQGDANSGNLLFPVTPGTDENLVVDREQEMGETMMMGLRLTDEGVSRAEFRHRFGSEMDEIYKNEIAQLIGLGLVEWELKHEDRLRITPQGRMLGNQVFIHFV